MSLDYSAESQAPALAASVVALVLVHESSDLPGALDALAGQVYEPVAGFVVGGDEAMRSIAEERGLRWLPSIREALGHLPEDASLVWLLHDRARPRPGALQALVAELERVDASIAGSKMLDRADPRLLESIGFATDVYDVPFAGLEDGEIDQRQYEVVRDVAVVPSASLLVRRDLLRGLGGLDPRLAPQAAVIDFCQRARLRGSRIIVVPTSEVLVPHRPRTGTSPWREEAGRVRAMLKVYSPLTLLWALPVAFFSGLVEALVAPFVGRWTLLIWVRTWLWNLAYLPSTIAGRIRARRGRVAGDSELFRYQVRGSMRLRSLFGEVAERIRERLPENAEGLTGIVEAGQQTVRSPAFLAAAGTALFVVLATRSIWSGALPVVGYSLPPPESVGATLDAYAGGWNPAGLGSPEPLHPSLAALALTQVLVFGNADLAATLATMIALFAGVLGMSRLLRARGLSAIPAYLGGVVLVAGPGARALAGRTEWTALLAVGVLPWVVRVAMRRWPGTWRGRIGRVAAVTWLTGLAAALHPALLVVPLAAVAVWALVGYGSRWTSPAVAAGGALLAVPMLFPWFGVVSLSGYLRAGPDAYWDVFWLTGIAALVAIGATVLSGDRTVSALGAWGGLLTIGGVLVARLGTIDAGRNVAAAGMALAALGLGVAAGAALEAAARIERVGSSQKIAAVLAGAGAVVLVAAAVGVAGPGRAGLPGDVYRSALSFTTGPGAVDGDARVLVAGPPELLPGDSRTLDGAAYRVVSAPVPRLWEARLNAPKLGDEALEATLRSIVSGEVARAGEALAPFGVRWIVVVGETPFADVFEGQLDLIPLQSLDDTVFLSEVEAVRAATASGETWTWDPPGYADPGDGDGAVVLVAENADQRWGPGEWRQVDWHNRIATDAARVEFAVHAPFRREAIMAGAVAGVALLLAVWGTGRRSR